MLVLLLAVPALLLVVAIVSMVASWQTTGNEMDRLFATLAPAPSGVSPAVSARQTVLG
ncbi:MAG: hypothetical protein U0Q14_09615 [Dermatophilaceae bacterium]|jgi:hypothetical protein|nr:hypothetical protein [Candidatus Lutibacillus vidarii]HRB99613.1 hypothetical protein [Dermatophilaceae bacterium]